jgi:hypothetical protein
MKLEKAAKQLKALSPPCTTELPKPSSIPTTTPRKRRMASMLDAVMESMKTSTPASAEAPSTEGKVSKKSNEAGIVQTIYETGPSEVPTEARPSKSAPMILEKEGASEKSKSPAPEAPAKELEFIVRHASGKQLSEEQIAEAKQYAKDDFLYCLPDNKEIYVCREMMKNMEYPKLELGLSATSKDDLIDSLAYNSLKVRIFSLIK